jgi:hypothetical protein
MLLRSSGVPPYDVDELVDDSGQRRSTLGDDGIARAILQRLLGTLLE